MTLKALARALRLISKQTALIEAQNMLIEDLQHDLRHAKLDHLKEMHGVIGAWIINLEQPELDVRRDLAELDRTLGHQVAVLEEHIV
jgi:hypothetical protein